MKAPRVVVCVALVAVLTACGEMSDPQAASPIAQQSKQDVTPVEVPTPAATAPAATPVPGTQVISGIALDFPNTVRSDKVEDADAGVKRHNLRVEYQTIDEIAVSKSLNDTFTKNGFKVAANGEQKFVAYAKDGRKIRYAISVVGPDMGIKLAPDSKGLVTFIWDEVPSTVAAQ